MTVVFGVSAEPVATKGQERTHIATTRTTRVAVVADAAAKRRWEDRIILRTEARLRLIPRTATETDSECVSSRAVADYLVTGIQPAVFECCFELDGLPL